MTEVQKTISHFIIYFHKYNTWKTISIYNVMLVLRKY